MERRFKIDQGDWVMLRSANPATARPGKVIKADSEGVTVNFRFDGGSKQYRYGEDGLQNLVRVRWQKGRDGRNRWKVAA